MFAIKIKFIVISFCIFMLKSQALEKDTFIEENVILATESTIKYTTYKLFAELHLRKLNKKTRHSLLVHNFFNSITLRDHKNWNLIVKLSRVDKKDAKNETDYITANINDILNEDENLTDIDSIARNKDIIQYVDEFLTNLKVLKESAGFNNDGDSLEVKNEIVRILKGHNSVEHNMWQTQPNITVGFDSEEDRSLLSESDFWVPEPKRRIYQGQRTKIKYYPFMASIHIFKGFQCAGSIVKSDLIVTAASCLQLAWNNRFFRENPAFLSVRVGSNFYAGGGEEIPVLEVYFHPGYNPKNLRNNIAILRLLRHLKFKRRKRKLRKIDIDTDSSSLPMTTDGITIVGWGARGTSNVVRDPWSNQVAFAVLDVYDLQECQKIYSREYVTRTNFCAGFISKGGGACNHDVGGPGVVNGILTGVISFGSPVCGAPDAPTVFTKVGFYSEWIEEIMAQDVPRIKKKTTLQYRTTAATYSPTTTTKLTPLGRIKVPNPFLEEDLRISEEEQDIFKEFLSTMFENKEVKELRDLLNEMSTDTSKDVESDQITMDDTLQDDTKEMERTVAKDMGIKDEDDQESVEQPTFYTKMDGIESETERFRYTVLDDNMLKGDDHDDIADKNIVQLIDNVDLSKTDEKSTSTSRENGVVIETLAVPPNEAPPNPLEKKILKTKEDEFELSKANEKSTINSREFKQIVEILTPPSTETPPQPLEKKTLKTKENEIFTIFYLSENEKNESSEEKNENNLEDFDDNFSEGLAIAESGFNDLSYKNNKRRSVLDFMFQNSLYDLLSEAINEVMRNKTGKSFCFFSLRPAQTVYLLSTPSYTRTPSKFDV